MHSWYIPAALRTRRTWSSDGLAPHPRSVRDGAARRGEAAAGTALAAQRAALPACRRQQHPTQTISHHAKSIPASCDGGGRRPGRPAAQVSLARLSPLSGESVRRVRGCKVVQNRNNVQVLTFVPPVGRICARPNRLIRQFQRHRRPGRA